MSERKINKFQKFQKFQKFENFEKFGIFSKKSQHSFCESNLFQLECDSKIFNAENININSNSNSNDYSNIFSYNICNELYPLSLQGNNLDYFLTNLNILKIFNLNFITTNYVQNYDLTLDENLKKFYDHLERMKRISTI
jgi:hypothetical protein